jgi:hypothetical protein
MPRHIIPPAAVRIAKRISKPISAGVTPERERALKAQYESKRHLYPAIYANHLASDPALNAALIKVRDASVAYRAARDPFHRVGGWSGRSNEAKKLRGEFESAQLARDHAFDDLLAIIDPASAEGV